MRARRLTLVALLVALAALASATPAVAGSGFTLTPRAGDRFPTRTFLLTLPPGSVATAETLHADENGGPVAGLDVTPLTDTSELGVVLIIDASKSMRGTPINAAMAAARAFATHRDPKQPLSVIVFNSRSVVTLPFTTNQSKIDAALAATPTLGTGTHMIDAVNTAEQEIAAAHITSASMVVLSDGADTGSTATLAAVAASARQQHARIFSVGLESAQFRPATLTSLAQAGGGIFTAARSSSQLSSIYDRLGAQLANQYLVSYQSLAAAEAHVAVRITIDGVAGTFSTSYTAPALTRVSTPPYHRSVWSRLLSSWLSALLVAVLGGLLFAFAVVTIVQPRSRAFRRRVRPFVPQAAEDPSSAPAITEALYDQTERVLGGTRWWDRFSEDVELSRIAFTAAQAVVIGVTGGLLLALALVAISGSWVMIIFAPLVPVIGRILISLRADRQRFAFATQLPDNLQVLASALRAGHSLVGALAIMTDDAAEPSRSEFRRLIGEERVGVPVDESLAEISRRMRSREVMQIALVTIVQQQTGGNTAEILDQVATNVRGRFELRRLVRTLTAQGRVSRWIVTALPIVLFLLIYAINPGYTDPLLHTTAGQILMVMSGGMTVLGSFAISKIVHIEI
jgi:tight adherence protein B